MIQALNMPYSSKTDEIMSRYRPIAPKPELPNISNGGGGNGSSTVEGSLVPEKFRQSPYLRNMWSHLQARPTRTRKRGRTAGISPAAATAMLRKHQENEQRQFQQQQHKLGGAVGGGGPGFVGLCSPTNMPSHARNLSFQAFGIYGGDDQHANRNGNANVTNDNNAGRKNVVELPLLSSCPSLLSGGERKAKAMDLNAIAESTALEERDLLLQLQIIPANNNVGTTKVISPRPVRPVGSTISIVGPISEDPETELVPKSAEEVEAEVEVEALPAVISDRGNKVRMVNSAYKELVGQPECQWLDSMVSSRRISGEVVLQFEVTGLPVTGNGFNCWVRIEWESDGVKNYVNAFCEVVRLACESKDYVYYWRFHTREVSPSGSKV